MTDDLNFIRLDLDLYYSVVYNIIGASIMPILDL